VSALFDGIAWVLSFFYGLWPSYGGAIILLTLVVMVVMTPLTLKGTRSMMAMQRLQPEMKRIQDKYKDDREKLNEELLAFYRENNINPVGGCLPLLLQMPVFIVLYRVVSGLTLAGTKVGVPVGWAGGQAGRGLGLTEAPEGVVDQAFEPAYLDHSSELYRSLAGSDEMPFLGLDLAKSTSQAFSLGVVDALPYLLMIALVAGTGWYQQRQMQARSTSAPNPQQQTISRVMLFFLPAISFGLPAGVVLYFIVSNLYRVGQQAYITRTLYRGDDPIPAVTETPDDKATKKGAVAAGPVKKPGGKGPAASKGPTTGGKGAIGAGRKKGDASGAVRPKSGSGGTAKGAKKTFTSDPRRKTGSTSSSTPPVQARPRKKRK
jgi:YidC/Oxa1 family membrane protein insertase